MPQAYVYQSLNPYEFSFISDSDIEYVILFLPYKDFNVREEIKQTVFSVVLACAVDFPPKDYNVAVTIKDIFLHFFEKNDACVIYTPDFSDQRQATRNHIFSRWVNQFNTNHKFTIINVLLDYEKHQLKIYVNLIHGVNYRYRDVVMKEFENQIGEFESIK